MKTFEMFREADESGVSGTGKVLEGSIFNDGTTVVRWCVNGKPNSTGVYSSYEAFELLHITSHPTNKTRVIFSNNETIEEVCDKCDKECDIRGECCKWFYNGTIAKIVKCRSYGDLR